MECPSGFGWASVESVSAIRLDLQVPTQCLLAKGGEIRTRDSEFRLLAFSAICLA